MQTQLEKLRQLWSLGDYRACLKLAAGWSRLGAHMVPIQRAWSSILAPELYKEMGYDVDVLFEDGKKALAARYNLPL